MSNCFSTSGEKVRCGADAGLFFYAGHGLQVARQKCLVPIDVRAESEDKGFAMTTETVLLPDGRRVAVASLPD